MSPALPKEYPITEVFTANTPNGIKLPIALEELGAVKPGGIRRRRCAGIPPA